MYSIAYILWMYKITQQSVVAGNKGDDTMTGLLQL